ncbi:TRAF family member-associated NF-kappa-B activator-like [Leptodactylus fuscus]|uniref:TRAF family member-associated NF-kappa-B activator-like n=1 Tax=Leptodactylus fuscus TaxID=238119 RepID=UPI003F4EDAAD
MEDAFLELYKEFKNLQIICLKQAELLQKLLSKKGGTSDMPVSKPIQCTDTGDNARSESPFFRLKGKEDLVEASKTKTDEEPTPLEPNENSSLLLDLDIRFPPYEDQYNFLTSVSDKEEALVGIPCADKTTDKREENSNFALFFKNYTPRFLDTDTVGGEMGPTKLYNDLLTPGNTDGNFTVSDMYEEDINFLKSSDVLYEALLEPRKNTNGVRGPAQSSWSPQCLSEDCPFGQHTDINSDIRLSSQICEFCQAVFPAGAATGGEFFGHLAGHME